MVEYRVLSSALLRSKERLNFVWNGTMKAIEEYNKKKSLPDANEIQEAINTTNLEMAKKIMEEYNIPVIK